MATKKTKQRYNFSSVDLLIYIWEKRWILISVSLIAAVVSIIVSFQITPKFKSAVIMFPATNAPVSKSLLSPYYSGRPSVYDIGDEDQGEQILQILNSSPLRDKIIQKYNLMEHYEIDPDAKYPYTQLYNKYNSNISYSMTEYMAVRIEVMDTDPQMAADMANDIAALVDTVYHEMKMQRTRDAFMIVENAYFDTKKDVEELQDSLEFFGEMGIDDLPSQTERYTEAYAKALKENQLEGARRIKDEMKVMGKYGAAYRVLFNKFNAASARLADLQRQYNEARVELEQELPHKFIVDAAKKAERKAYPRKSIIVIISTLSAFLLTLILLIINDNIRERLDVRNEE